MNAPEVLWRDDALPYLEVRFHPSRRHVVLTSTGAPKATDEWTVPTIEVRTGPANFAPSTADPDRLRAMAAALTVAADRLADELATHSTGTLFDV